MPIFLNSNMRKTFADALRYLASKCESGHVDAQSIEVEFNCDVFGTMRRDIALRFRLYGDDADAPKILDTGMR